MMQQQQLSKASRRTSSSFPQNLRRSAHCLRAFRSPREGRRAVHLLGLFLFTLAQLAPAHAAEPAPAASAAPAEKSAEKAAVSATESSAPKSDAPAAATSAAAPAATAGGGAPDLNFDMFGDAAKPEKTPEQLLAAEKLERLSKIRRKMLTAHQVLGFTTLAVLAATVIIGQLNYQDKYVSGDFTGRYEKAHLGLSIGATSLFGATGMLALFAPNPYPKPIRFDTALVHKVSMILATAAMVTQVVLGPVTVDRVGKQNQSSLALGHLITGWASFGFMAAGTIAYVF
jgi:hypothetical protein